MRNDPKNTGAETVEQFKVMQFIGEQFAPDALELELIDRFTIRTTDNTGAAITFYWDPDAGEVKWHD